ncbi:unnamed protein product [Closterium sp. Naga37s-1]|nr:unnamed protein product [Closterium sp. Naga37s-1]
MGVITAQDDTSSSGGGGSSESGKQIGEQQADTESEATSEGVAEGVGGMGVFCSTARGRGGCCSLIVALLFMEAHKKALQVPGRALSAIITHLKSSLSPADFSSLSTLHFAVVAPIGKSTAGERGQAGEGEGGEGVEERVHMEALLKGPNEVALGKANVGTVRAMMVMSDMCVVVTD